MIDATDIRSHLSALIGLTLGLISLEAMLFWMIGMVSGAIITFYAIKYYEKRA
jgi:hypothetical protein